MRAAHLYLISILSLLIPLYGSTTLKDSSIEPPFRFILSVNPEKSPSLQAFENHLNEEGVAHTILQDLTLVPDVYFGVSIELYTPDDLERLEASSHVRHISPVMKVDAPVLVKQEAARPFLPGALPDYPPHLQTNVTQLHQLGIYGHGIKIAFLDTGVDCAHPALGGGFGPGFKIGFGYDLVGENYTGYNKPQPDANPCNTCADHATHVAGIIGANNIGGGFVGAAPNATLGAYRVFSCHQKTGTSDDIIMAALLRAHKDGADIISASLGFIDGWSEGTPVMETVNNLVEKKGATIIFSAGNSGDEGLFYAEGPASARAAISVATVESSGAASEYLETSTGRKITYYAPRSLDEFTGNYPIYATANSTNVTNDACDALPSSTPNLTDFVVLIRVGSCWFDTQARNAHAMGASKILFYMNDDQIINVATYTEQFRMAALSRVDGEYLFGEHKKNPQGFTVHFPPTSVVFGTLPGDSQGQGLINDWSTYGPSYDFVNQQPTIAAIGGDVLSTFPTIRGSYDYMSGTSMAAPQLAGIAALVMSVRGKDVRGLSMRARLASTAIPVRDAIDASTLHTVVQQGGGLVNAYCAAFANTSVSTSSLPLNDTSNFEATHTFDVINEGSIQLEYSLSHIPAATVYTFSGNSSYSRPDKSPHQDKQAATVIFSSQKISIRPHESKTVTVIFEPPRVDPKLLAVYSGFIKLSTNTLCEDHTIPYHGSVGSVKDQIIIDHGPTTDDNGTYTLPALNFGHHKDTLANTEKDGSLIWNRTLYEKVHIDHRLNFATRSFRFYAVSLEEPSSFSGASLQQKKFKRDPITQGAHESNLTSNTDCATLKGNFPMRSCDGLNILGEVGHGHMARYPRSASEDTYSKPWNGTLYVGSNLPRKMVPKGKYKILIRALRLTGDPTNEHDYETWLSNTITIQD
ncbi:subtilisin protease [Melampsora americana]|nr:subtilisin protease [Melampsora americana]